MLLSVFEQYKSEYVANARKISVRSSHPKVMNKQPFLKLKEAPNNFDLFFCKSGLLMYSLSKGDYNNFNTLYAYNEMHSLLNETLLDPKGTKIIKTKQFLYDDNQRILSEKHS